MNDGRKFLLGMLRQDMRPADVRRAFEEDMTFAERHVLLHDGMKAQSHRLSHDRHDVPLIAALLASVDRDGRTASPAGMRTPWER